MGRNLLLDQLGARVPNGGALEQFQERLGERMFDTLRGMRRCDFCASPMVKWRYPAERDWLACEKCRAAIQRDDREALLGRVMQQPVPGTLPDRYAPQFREQARKLHEEFWATRSGPPRPA
jgi:hypothetical protein